jgi:hypothetical protein
VKGPDLVRSGVACTCCTLSRLWTAHAASPSFLCVLHLALPWHVLPADLGELPAPCPSNCLQRASAWQVGSARVHATTGCWMTSTQMAPHCCCAPQPLSTAATWIQPHWEVWGHTQPLLLYLTLGLSAVQLRSHRFQGSVRQMAV